MDGHTCDVFVGKLIHTPSLGELEITDATVGVYNGKIVFLEKSMTPKTLEEAKSHHLLKEATIHKLKPLQFMFPGLIDTHIHAPQYPNSGIGIDVPLLQWLEKYTFPLESSLADLEEARQVYKRVVERTLSNGTTFASYFSTLHTPTSALLAEICYSYGQRAYIGKCNMNNLSPDHYCEKSAESSLEATRQLISYMSILDPKREMVTPIITPRFAPSCTEDLLSGCGELAEKHNLPIQTHISENTSEIELVKELFPERKSYADVYDYYKLLTPQTILAHAIHLEDEEIELLTKRSSGISHCPTSNSILASGLANVRKLLDSGINVGLGTDVSGGYAPSILIALRHAAMTSRSLSYVLGDPKVMLDLSELLYLATQGGAEVVSRGDQVGSFAVGKYWDALIVDLSAETHSCVDIFERDTWPVMLSKWVFTSDDRNLAQVWVNGRLVSGFEMKANLKNSTPLTNGVTSSGHQVFKELTQAHLLPRTQCVDTPPSCCGGHCCKEESCRTENCKGAYPANATVTVEEDSGMS
ncbi:guanine deaminase Gud1 [Schizosaccharomyces pombe]|uniref:Probable guanine deaminase n=1 Tax=Schizosaccharomyces pombe (strain 972 / ATCC 24843) TaxID=284812 RepID=GUAD_SCHPO|nr:putative guanine deaminase [Schizosaccharomyces pombe]O14057.1 RecName: Full=Probable guanine deaminase; Short=Guanase; Short=Guanine aminase; AltName: Full=Guanine aminohydrolase; Short=GAH [Schizosaccharomyces pombe 972h-]CAA20441.1 guanine deaminase (predicted) [Schizosaccharomyces pombe]|eukprot:NP_587874.1 putative guanine deaminase [Schizosaccharomyces pombe]